MTASRQPVLQVQRALTRPPLALLSLLHRALPAAALPTEVEPPVRALADTAGAGLEARPRALVVVVEAAVVGFLLPAPCQYCAPGILLG